MKNHQQGLVLNLALGDFAAQVCSESAGGPNGLTFFQCLNALDALSARFLLRFPLFGGHRTLRRYVLACLGPSNALAAHLCSEITQGRVKFDPYLVVFWGGWGPGREPLRRVTGTFIADTVYLLLDT